jgi:type III secretion protein L
VGMVIWLKSPRAVPDAQQYQIGVDSDVIPRAQLGALLELDDAYRQLELDREQILEQAREEARQLIEAAQRDAQIVREQAQMEYDVAGERGYQDGEQKALADWVGRLADASADEQRIHERMRKRLAEVVTVAVERIVNVQQTRQLFEQAATTIDQILEGTSYLKVFVSPEDFEEAQAVFERLALRWRELGKAFPLSVVTDKRLPAGSCICESDFGSIDASLATQLRAMRSAVARAVKQSANLAELSEEFKAELMSEEGDYEMNFGNSSDNNGASSDASGTMPDERNDDSEPNDGE